MSKMSHDRVHFTIPTRYLERETIRNCIKETLGISVTTGRFSHGDYHSMYDDLHVICRPSQFARFVILRHVKYGEPNNMSCLDMKLVVREQKSKQIDVSGNMNHIRENVG